MDYRAIVAAWFVGIAIVAGALYFSTVKQGGSEYAGIEPGTRVPLHDELPQGPRELPVESYSDDR